MRLPTALISGAVALVAVAALAPPALSAPLTITDPAGDALDARASMDLVSVTLESAIRKPGKTPSLVATFELAGPIDRSTATAVSYNLNTQIPGCGYLNFTWAPGTVLEGGPGGAYSNISTSCGGEPDSTGEGTYRGIDAKAELDGNKLIMWTSWESLTKEIRAAGALGSIQATTENAEPVTGIIGTGGAGLPIYTDELTSDKTWSFS